MIKKCFSILCCFLFITACKTLYTQKKAEQISISSVELGALGLKSKGLNSDNFQQVGVPVLPEKIRLKAVQIPFDKSTYKKYTALMRKSGQPNQLILSDSLNTSQPKYIKLAIADRIGMTKALNAAVNTGAQHYLQQDSAYKMVCSVNIVLSPDLYTLFDQAEEVYLVQQNTNRLGLELMKGDNVIKSLNFVSLTTFDFELASFCWGKDKHHKTTISAMIDMGQSCPKNTSKKASKTTKKNEFKFFK